MMEGSGDVLADILGPQDAEGRRRSAWLRGNGSYELADGYCHLFWPSFVRFENFVLRTDFSLAALRDLEEMMNLHSAGIEEEMNLVRIAEIHSEGSATEDKVRELGRLLADSHSAKLARDFPDLGFEVSFNDAPGLDLRDYVLSFWQI